MAKWRLEDEAAVEELQGSSAHDVEASLTTNPSSPIRDDDDKDFSTAPHASASQESDNDVVGGEHDEGVPYSEIVKRYPLVRQSYVEGHQGAVGAAVAACHHWKRQAEACFQQHKAAKGRTAGRGGDGEARCMKLQMQFMLCMGEHVVPQHFDRVRKCLGANRNDISKCEAPLLEMMNNLEQKAQIENRQREAAHDSRPMARRNGEDDMGEITNAPSVSQDIPDVRSSASLGLTAWEQEQLIECGLKTAQQSEIDCMIPRVCTKEHEVVRRCLADQLRRSRASITTKTGSEGACIEPVKHALRCWGAFNRRREHTEHNTNAS